VAGERRSPTFGDMIRTIVIFAVIIVAIVAFLLPRGHHTTATQSVDYTSELNVVQHRSPFHVLAPQGLPDAWVPTHVTIAVPQQGKTITTFDVGFYVSTANAYVHLQQSNDPKLQQTTLGPKAKQAGTQVIGAQSWQRWTDSSGRPALVRPDSDGSVVVLSGKASDPVLGTQLDVLAAALR
jgi:hypothetical protein